MRALWVFVTDCGDSAVTLPLALLTLIFLAAVRERRIAAVWLLAIAGAAIAIAALKLAFGACGQRLPLGHIASPSGHTAMSTAIYGALALLLGRGLPWPARVLTHLAAALGIIGIGISRVVLHEHNLPEIVIGWIVGAGAAALFGHWLRRQAPPALPLGWLLLSGAVVFAAMHGTRWMVEPAIHRLAWDFRLALPWCR